MHFCAAHCLIFKPNIKIKLNRRRRKSHIATSSSQQHQSTMSSASTSQTYIEPERTLLTLINKLEVFCELMVDFKSMADNGYDFRHTVRFQGWIKYFDRLVGPVFPTLVKEFWIHAQAYHKVIISSVMGKKLMIIEKLISQLIGYEHTEVVTTPANRRT